MDTSTLNTFLPPAFFELGRTVGSTYIAGVVLFVIGLLAAKSDVAQARGLDKVVALGGLFFGLPLAVFAAEHFAAADGISQMVPKFVPWHLFWAYFVGCCLLAASLSIATKVLVQWSGLLFGVLMFSFVVMMDIPATVSQPHNRIFWTLALREASFGAGGWLLASAAMDVQEAQFRKVLFTIGRVVIGVGAIFYGVEHFLHQVNVPGVPLEKLMPAWIPGSMVIGYVTGAILIVAGACILIAMKTRMAATYLGAWIALLVFTVYLAILIASFPVASTDVRVEGVNYYADTMLYAGAILALARAASVISGSSS